MAIFVDYREPAEIIPLLQNAERKLLPSADYLIGDIAIERKTVSDFCQTLYDGRLFSQLAKMKNDHTNCFLLIEGIISPIIFSNSRLFYSITQKITILLKIPILFSESLQNTVQIILRLQERKPVFLSAVTFYYGDYTKQIQEQILCSFPGIGRKQAKLLLEHFGSLRALFHAKSYDVTKCIGMGRKRAKSIREVLDYEWTKMGNNDYRTS